LAFTLEWLRPSCYANGSKPQLSLSLAVGADS